MELRDGYKQTEVGIIPDDWVIAPIGSLGVFSKGQGIRKDEAKSGDIPCIRYGEIYTHHNDIIRYFNSYISSEVAKTSKRLKKGDILFAGSGETKEEIGKSVALLEDLEVYAGGDIVILSTTKGVPQFLGYLFNVPLVTRQKASKGQGDAVVHISASALSSISIPFPPNDEEQRAIATALSDMDGLLEGLDQLIAKKRDLKQATMQQLLTGKTRLPEFCAETRLSGDVRDGEEPIEDEWEVKRLGDVVRFQNGTALEKYFNHYGGMEVISIGNYSPSGKFVKTGSFISHDFRNEVEKFVLNKNELAMILNDKTAVGSIIGRVLLIDKDNHYVFNQRTMRLSCKKEITPLFAYHLINSDIIHEKILLAAKPGTQIYVNTDDVLSLELILPSVEEQTAIATTLSDMDTEIQNLEQRRTKTRDLKQAMMQELLTGKTRLIANRE